MLRKRLETVLILPSLNSLTMRYRNVTTEQTQICSFVILVVNFTLLGTITLNHGNLCFRAAIAALNLDFFSMCLPLIYIKFWEFKSAVLVYIMSIWKGRFEVTHYNQSAGASLFFWIILLCGHLRFCYYLSEKNLLTRRL